MFHFKDSVNPRKPLDPADPAPESWEDGIDTSDYRGALFGFPSDLFERCCNWEKRELGRVAAKLAARKKKVKPDSREAGTGGARKGNER